MEDFVVSRSLTYWDVGVVFTTVEVWLVLAVGDGILVRLWSWRNG